MEFSYVKGEIVCGACRDVFAPEYVRVHVGGMDYNVCVPCAMDSRIGCKRCYVRGKTNVLMTCEKHNK